jgi:hypothetical protein
MALVPSLLSSPSLRPYRSTCDMQDYGVYACDLQVTPSQLHPTILPFSLLTPHPHRDMDLCNLFGC